MCNFIKKDGKKCNSISMINSKFCYFHNPQTKSLRKISSGSGGKANKKLIVNGSFPEVKLNSISSINKFIVLMINKILINQLDIRVGNSLNYLLQTLLKSIELSEIETRISKIEKKLIN